MVGNNSSVKDHYAELQNLVANKSGFVYIYCSNESPVNVFFDNVQVVQTRSPILEETHYYPFGLTMSGISSRNAGNLENKIKFNGIEFENDFDLNYYDAFYRELDAQTGRWWEIDPKVDEFYAWSPYNLNFDNPIKFTDPLGDNPILGKLAKMGIKWAGKTMKGYFKPVTREGAIKLLEDGKSVFSTSKNSAKDAKKLMKEAADGKKVVRHDGHKIQGGKIGKPHYQKSSGDGSHVFYNTSTLIMLGLNPGGAALQVIGEATGLNNAGKKVVGDNPVGRFIDNWINPLN